MKTIADNIKIINGQTTTVLNYRATKINKTSVHYESTSEKSMDVFRTSIARLEEFRGYSRAEGCPYLLKVKTDTNWNKCSPVTGLFPTTTKDVFYGDIRENMMKTLILIILEGDEYSNMTIIVFPKGHYYQTNEINRIVSRL